MAIKNPAVPKAPEGIRDPKVDSYLQSDSKMIQSSLKDIALQNNWQVISADPTETPSRIPTIKLDTRGWLWIYFDGGWNKYPCNGINQDVEFDGDLILNQSQTQLIGGFGSIATSGTADWNHATNARSGNGYTLLLGTATNGPGPANYFYAFSFEYVSKDGTGNLTQLAIPYANTDGGVRLGIWMRCRYSSAWTNWHRLGPPLKTGYKKNLYVKYYSPNAAIGCSAWCDEIELYDAQGNPKIFYPTSQKDAVLTSSGAGGLDTGSEAASTRYFLHYVGKEDGVHNLVWSTSQTTPTLPSGYTYWRCIHEMYNDASSNLITYGMRIDDEVYYYRWWTVFTGVTVTTTWTAKAWPTGFPYDLVDHIHLVGTVDGTGAYQYTRCSCYAGDYWEAAGDGAYGHYGNSTYTLSYRYVHFTLPWRFSRPASVYVRTGYWNTNYASQGLRIRGYRLPR